MLAFSTPKACKKPLDKKTHPAPWPARHTQPSNHRHVRPGELNRLPVGQVQSSYALCVCRIRKSKKTMAAGRVAVGVGRPHNIKITYVQPSITLSIHARCPATFMYTSYVEPAPHETTPICTGAPPRITTSGPPSLDPPAARRVAPTRTQRARLVEGLDKKNHIATPAASAYCAATTRSRKHSAWRGWPGGASLSIAGDYCAPIGRQTVLRGGRARRSSLVISQTGVSQLAHVR